jgi:phospholipase/carboxylesterase
MTLPTFEIEPREEHRGTVLWMHGLGATNHDFEDVVPLLDLPFLRYVFPQAPNRPVTINGGMRMPAWYDILSFDDPLREDEPGIRASESEIVALLGRELERGASADRIVVMGFSQGGAMALHVGTRFSQRLAGIGVLSGYLVLPERFASERHASNRDTKVLFCHGQFDAVVPIERGKAAYDVLAHGSSRTEFHAFPMQHSMSLPEIEVLRAWLGGCFAD